MTWRAASAAPHRRGLAKVAVVEGLPNIAHRHVIPHTSNPSFLELNAVLRRGGQYLAGPTLVEYSRRAVGAPRADLLIARTQGLPDIARRVIGCHLI
jgi:hypothetical protein